MNQSNTSKPLTIQSTRYLADISSTFRIKPLSHGTPPTPSDIRNGEFLGIGGHVPATYGTSRPSNACSRRLNGENPAYSHQRFASALKGNVLNSRATRQKTMAKPMKHQSHSRKRPVKTPIPMYRKTTNSESVAKEAKMYSAVIWHNENKTVVSQEMNAFSSQNQRDKNAEHEQWKPHTATRPANSFVLYGLQNPSGVKLNTDM